MVCALCFASLLHASGIELASGHRHSDHTGGKSEEQCVAHPVQSERQQLPGLHRVLSTPASQKRAETHKTNRICINQFQLLARDRALYPWPWSEHSNRAKMSLLTHCETQTSQKCSINKKNCNKSESDKCLMLKCQPKQADCGTSRGRLAFKNSGQDPNHL